MSLAVGTQVHLKIRCLGTSPYTIGYVFNDYKDGSQVIFENGAYDGFSNEEIPDFLEVIGSVDFIYAFTNVMKLSEDFNHGVFASNGCFTSTLSSNEQLDQTQGLDEDSNADVKSRFVDVANGKGNHGSFLVSFASTLLRADRENFQLLKPIAEILIRKYNL